MRLNTDSFDTPRLSRRSFDDCSGEQMVGPDSLATSVAPPRPPSSLCHDMKNSRRLRKVFSLHAAFHDPMEKDITACRHPRQVAVAVYVTL